MKYLLALLLIPQLAFADQCIPTESIKMRMVSKMNDREYAISTTGTKEAFLFTKKDLLPGPIRNICAEKNNSRIVEGIKVDYFYECSCE